jgi:hypothetical protein
MAKQGVFTDIAEDAGRRIFGKMVQELFARTVCN